MSGPAAGPSADVVLGWVPASAVEATTASVAQPTPSPSPSPQSFSPLEVSPGLAGFVPVFLIALACIVLFLSLTRHLRRVTVRQAQVDAAEREQQARDEPGGPSGATGPDDGPGRR